MDSLSVCKVMHDSLIPILRWSLQELNIQSFEQIRTLFGGIIFLRNDHSD